MKVFPALCRDAAVVALLCLPFTGCTHPQPAPTVPAPAITPNVYVPPPPQPNLPPMEAPPPKSVSEAKPTVTPEVKPKRRKKPSTQTPTTPMVAAAAPPPKLASDVIDTNVPPPGAAVAPATPPVSSALGELSPGGASSPQHQQEVADRIALIERKLNDLPAPTVDSQKKQVAQVRLFLKQASDALKTGDAEGAGNLATKAGLLLDDILK